MEKHIILPDDFNKDYYRTFKVTKSVIMPGLYLFFLLMIFQNLIKAHFESQYLFLGYILGVFLLIFAFIFFLVKKQCIEITDLDKLILAYIFIQMVYILPTLQISIRAAVVGFLYGIRNLFLPYAIIRFSLIGAFDKIRLIRWMAFLVIIFAVYGIYQFYFDWDRLADLSKDVGGLFYSSGKRAYSFLLTPLDTAYGCMVLGNLMFAYILIKNRVFGVISKSVFFIILIFALFLTFTRSAYLGIFFGMLGILYLYLIKSNLSWKLIFAGLLPIVIIMAAILWKFPQLFYRITRFYDASALFHYSNTIEGLKLFLAYPFGIGVGKTGFTVVNWNIGQGVYFESSFIQVLVETGVLGISILIAIWIKILLLSASNFMKNGNPIFLGLFGATIGIVIGSFFLPVYQFSTAMSFYWGFVAIAIFYKLERT
jgi:hypothetical protein